MSSFFLSHGTKTGLLKVPFLVALEKTQVLRTLKAPRRNNSTASGCKERTEIVRAATETQLLYHGKLSIYPSPHKHNQHQLHSNEIAWSLEKTTQYLDFYTFQ